QLEATTTADLAFRNLQAVQVDLLEGIADAGDGSGFSSAGHRSDQACHLTVPALHAFVEALLDRIEGLDRVAPLATDGEDFASRTGVDLDVSRNGLLGLAQFVEIALDSQGHLVGGLT